MLTSFCDSFPQVLGIGREAFKNWNLWDKVFTGWLVISCLFWRKIPGTPCSCPPSCWGLFHCPIPLLLTGLRLRARKCVCVPPNTGHSVLYYFQPVGPGNLYLLFFISSPWTLETLDSKNNPCHSVVQNASVHVFSWNCFSLLLTPVLPLRPSLCFMLRTLCVQCPLRWPGLHERWVWSRVEQGVAGKLGIAGLTPPTLPGLFWGLEVAWIVICVIGCLRYVRTPQHDPSELKTGTLC